MTVFYRGPCVRITHEVIEVWCPAYRSFALRELSLVHVAEQAADPPIVIGSLRNGSSGVAGAAAVAVALGWAEGWQAYESPVLALATITLLVVSVVVSTACWLVRPVERELAAAYRGRLVSLYRTTDAPVFGQVKRALARALEQISDTP